MTIKERLAVIETELKHMKRLIYIIIIATIGNVGLEVLV